MELPDFVRVHQMPLLAAGVPEGLHARLFDKLRRDVLDAGERFAVELVRPSGSSRRGRPQRRVVLAGPAGGSLLAESDVFLVDHAWSFRLADARKQLEQAPGLVERMAALMGCKQDAAVEEECEEEEGGEERGNPRPADGGDGSERQGEVEAVLAATEEAALAAGEPVRWLELDELVIDDSRLDGLALHARFPELEGLSLWGNSLQSVEAVVAAVAGMAGLRALWLNANPVAVSCGADLQRKVQAALPLLELYNSTLTPAYTLWALSFCDKGGSDSTKQGPLLALDVGELDLSDRALPLLKPEVFNSERLPHLRSLHLEGNMLSAQPTAEIIAVLHSLPLLEDLHVDVPGPLGPSTAVIAEFLPGLQKLNGESTALLKTPDWIKKEQLHMHPRLPPVASTGGPPLVDAVMEGLWQYACTYRLATDLALDETPIWYVMDEFGSAFRHSDNPNFKFAPFMYFPDGTLKSAISYSLVWPIKNVKLHEDCTRDFLPGVGEEQQRSARLTAWFHTPPDVFREAYHLHTSKLAATRLPERPQSGSQTSRLSSQGGGPLKVYSDLPYIHEFLSRAEFVLGKSRDHTDFCFLSANVSWMTKLLTWDEKVRPLCSSDCLAVEDPAESDIVWASIQIDDEVRSTARLRPGQLINQFPYEACLVMKHHLASTVHQAYGEPNWMQPTYDLSTQLPALIGDYQLRQQSGQNNLWILKPWNMARRQVQHFTSSTSPFIDTVVVDTLPAIVRMLETGPKIAQKYIEAPALYNGRKFDLRYLVLLRSLDPLELFVSDVFWARLANNPYNVDKRMLNDFQTHFTVMNYVGLLNHVNTHEFVATFEKEHEVHWATIQTSVNRLLRDLFEAARCIHPEMQSEYSRAIYGCDIMLDNQFQPKLLEVTYCPDCTRATKYDMQSLAGDGRVYKGVDFFNDVFGCLFLKETRNMTRL
eukprot:SM000256S08679  [mRNA]  locus=s256:71999:76864:+ [translate_table: standard]